MQLNRAQVFTKKGSKMILDTQKLSIAVVFHDADLYSGATSSMLDLIETWVLESCFNIIGIFPYKGSAVEKMNSWGCDTILFNYPQFRYSVLEPRIRTIIAFPLRITRLILNKILIKSFLANKLKKFNLSLIYSNTGTIYTGMWLKQKLQLPHIWHIREFGREDQNYQTIASDKYHRKIIFENSDRVIVISKALMSFLIKDSSSSITAAKVKIVYDDISFKYDNYFDHNWNEKKILNILICGSIISGKGHKQVIDAVSIVNKELKRVQLKIAGTADGSYYEEIKNYIHELELDESVEFLGHVDDMNSLRRCCDIGIVASIKEAFGRVTIEGMLSNLVMIGSNTGSTTELITHQDTGLLYNQGDYFDLAEKLMFLYNNREEMYRIARNGYISALNFINGKAASRISNLIFDVINEKKN
ncbi:glycosyltransferase family 4 protein [uncultured Sphaerochaeta sp.]|uniref:glycosyltransferase family 4 protein n=1 Tax=uncultured Sphaerochaeta sp. TaxID=886478 RepID=UPI002A0A7BE4|nr:glycosyltransferase family 4 protein [uncultured Sphaerochaeta sp.]